MKKVNTKISKGCGVSAGYHAEVELCEKEQSNKYFLKVSLWVLAAYVIIIAIVKLANPEKDLMEGFLGPFMGSILFSISASLCMIGGLKERAAITEAKAFLKKISAVVSAIDTHEEYTDKGKRTSRRVYVSYSYDNVHYDHIPLSYYNSSMKEGYRVQVTIDSRKPGRTVSMGGSAVFITCAVIFYIPAIVFLLIGLLR